MFFSAAKQVCLSFQRRMILGNPLLDDCNEFLDLGENLLCLSLGGDKSVIVVDHVQFSPASLDVIAVRVRSFPKRELDHIEEIL